MSVQGHDTDPRRFRAEQCAVVEPFLELPEIVDALCARGTALDGAMRSRRGQPLPAKDVVLALVEELRSALFPGYFGIPVTSPEATRYQVGALLDDVFQALQVQIMRALCFTCEHEHGPVERCRDRAADLARRFMARLPEVRRLLHTDVAAAFEGDPALRSHDEAIFCYPGLHAVTNQRLAHELFKLGVPLIPRIITEHAHSLTGIDIHPGARIGERFFIDHGTGVVIGETTVIGNNCRLYQGVTLGAKSFPLDAEGKPIKGIDRHPILEDDVIIYAGATILGRVTIGRGAVIGGNVWLTRGVPPGARVTAERAREERFVEGAGI